MEHPSPVPLPALVFRQPPLALSSGCSRSRCSLTRHPNTPSSLPRTRTACTQVDAGTALGRHGLLRDEMAPWTAAKAEAGAHPASGEEILKFGNSFIKKVRGNPRTWGNCFLEQLNLHQQLFLFFAGYTVFVWPPIQRAADHHHTSGGPAGPRADCALVGWCRPAAKCDPVPRRRFLFLPACVRCAKGGKHGDR